MKGGIEAANSDIGYCRREIREKRLKPGIPVQTKARKGPHIYISV
jgi:hypothetical protein